MTQTFGTGEWIFYGSVGANGRTTMRYNPTTGWEEVNAERVIPLTDKQMAEVMRTSDEKRGNDEAT